MERVLDHLYGREYRGRGVRDDGPRGAGLDPSALSVPEWIHDVHELFPRETAEVIQRHALDRYGMTELVTDPDVLGRLQPSHELLKAILAFKGLMEGKVLEIARRLVREVVEDLRRRLATEVRRALWGKMSRLRRTSLRVFRNLDIDRTIRDNLRHYDRENRRIVLERLHFRSRVERHHPWEIVLAVDTSGSMIDSVIHAAVLAGIFRRLPFLRIRLLVFDTEIVDITDAADDPVEVLFGVQLGGGTDIGKAVTYCEGLVVNPTRTVVAVVTDFFEGGDPDVLVAAVRRLREAGARVLGLAALDAKAEPAYDREMAGRCVEAGAEVAALTPRRLAEWLGRALS